jgi:hypothetical protein
VQRVRSAGTQLLAACGPRWTGQVPVTPKFRRIKDLLLESLLFLMPLMLLAQLPRLGRTVTRRKPAIWTTVCLTEISHRQGRPDSALIWATYLQNWCVELHDSCSGFWSQTKVLGAAIVFCTLHNTSKYVCLSHVINSQY